MHIYVPSGRQTGWTEWANFFLWTLMGSLGVTKANKKIFKFFFSMGYAGPLCLIY